MALLNPTINAYRRIQPDSLAPTHANWGAWTTGPLSFASRRSAGPARASRSGSPMGPRTRIWRSRQCCPPAHTACGRACVRRTPVHGDAYRADPEAIGRALPLSLDAALEALEGDKVLCRALGPEIVETSSSPSSASRSSATAPGSRTGRSRSTSHHPVTSAGRTERRRLPQIAARRVPEAGKEPNSAPQRVSARSREEPSSSCASSPGAAVSTKARTIVNHMSVMVLLEDAARREVEALTALPSPNPRRAVRGRRIAGVPRLAPRVPGGPALTELVDERGVPHRVVVAHVVVADPRDAGHRRRAAP